MNRGWHRSYAKFHGRGQKDLFEKCVQFHQYADSVREAGYADVQYRLELLGPLDARIVVRAPDGSSHKMICFDSNSYLGLHLHPRVVSVVHRVLDEYGYGTASAQVLGGTNSHLLELERLMAEFYGRDDALIFPSGYQANVGILTGLLRKKDRAYIDEYSHASIHDGANFSGAKVRSFPHQDIAVLGDMLAADEGDFGKLIVSDGVFSMHGDLAPLPDLVAVARQEGARLMIDDAHGLGVIGPTGGGLEQHYGMRGETDLCMGTFSKAPGSLGGYICASKEVIEYLRYFARGSLFTATTPAALCAGLAESIRVMQDEPEHRDKLWENCHYLWNGFDDIGLRLRPLQSPIIPIAIGDENLQGPLALELFEAGIKCGFAQYPAVPMAECMLRFTVNARHERDDLDHTIDVLRNLSKRLPIGRNDAEAMN